MTWTQVHAPPTMPDDAHRCEVPPNPSIFDNGKVIRCDECGQHWQYHGWVMMPAHLFKNHVTIGPST